MSNKRWVEENGGWTLYFTPYYDETEVARIKLVDGDWWYCSEELNVEDDWLTVNTFEEAKEEVEQQLKDHYEDEINYYEELLGKFTEDD